MAGVDALDARHGECCVWVPRMPENSAGSLQATWHPPRSRFLINHPACPKALRVRVCAHNSCRNISISLTRPPDGGGGGCKKPPSEAAGAAEAAWWAAAKAAAGCRLTAVVSCPNLSAFCKVRITWNAADQQGQGLAGALDDID